jgi:dephospho-CoA kinase
MASEAQLTADKRLVVGIAGHIGAGKTTAGKYLSSRFGFQYLRYSKVLSEWLATDQESKSHLQEIGWEVMAKGMQAELNRRLIAQVEPGANAAVDGLRHPLDFENLRNSFEPSFHLVFIESQLEQRWKRKTAQTRYATLDLFKAADSHLVEEQIDLLRASAGLVIQNEGSLQDFYSALDKAVVGFQMGEHK